MKYVIFAKRFKMEDKSIIIMGDKQFPASEYQENVFDFLERGCGNLVINASAGAAKTTTLVNCMRFIPKDKKVMFVSFNKHIAEEINRRLTNPNATARTCSSVGFEICRENGHGLGVVDNDKYTTYIRENINSITKYKETASLSHLRITYMRNIRQLVDLCRYTLCFTLREIKNLADKYGIAPVRDEFEVCREILIWGKSNTEVIDQTDMVWLPNVLNLTTNRVLKDFIFIDEAQDITIAQQELIMKCAKRGARIIAVGDKNQQINVWCGSDEEAIERFKDMPGTIEASLPVCYRCGKKIIELANKISDGRMIAPPNAAEGEIIENVKIGEIRNGDMVLSRNTAPLIELQQKLLRINKKVYIQGYKEIRDDFLDIIKQNTKSQKIDVACVTDNGLFPQLYSTLLDNIDRLMSQVGMDEDEALSHHSVLYLYDNIKALEVLAMGVVSVDELVEKINVIFNGSKDDSSLLSTVHRAKGLEADRVFIYQNSLLLNNPLARKDWEIKTERNLLYVAYTRPKLLLGFLEEENRFKKNPFASQSNLRTDISRIRAILGREEATEIHQFTVPQVEVKTESCVAKKSDTPKDSKKGGLKFANLMKS